MREVGGVLYDERRNEQKLFFLKLIWVFRNLKNGRRMGRRKNKTTPLGGFDSFSDCIIQLEVLKEHFRFILSSYGRTFWVKFFFILENLILTEHFELYGLRIQNRYNPDLRIWCVWLPFAAASGSCSRVAVSLGWNQISSSSLPYLPVDWCSRCLLLLWARIVTVVFPRWFFSEAVVFGLSVFLCKFHRGFCCVLLLESDHYCFLAHKGCFLCLWEVFYRFRCVHLHIGVIAYRWWEDYSLLLFSRSRDWSWFYQLSLFLIKTLIWFLYADLWPLFKVLKVFFHNRLLPCLFYSMSSRQTHKKNFLMSAIHYFWDCFWDCFCWAVWFLNVFVSFIYWYYGFLFFVSSREIVCKTILKSKCLKKRNQYEIFICFYVNKFLVFFLVYSRHRKLLLREYFRRVQYKLLFVTVFH